MINLTGFVFFVLKYKDYILKRWYKIFGSGMLGDSAGAKGYPSVDCGRDNLPDDFCAKTQKLQVK